MVLKQVMEQAAYTWFNRFAALRYMELHDYLDHGFRVLSNPSGSAIPEILERAVDVDLPWFEQGPRRRTENWPGTKMLSCIVY